MFNQSGLEVEISERPVGQPLKMYACFDEQGNLAAASHLGLRDGVYVLEGLAVRDDLRGTGLGQKLMGLALDEARRLGATEVWGCAKVPDYYKKFGWDVADDVRNVPSISHCQECPQFQVDCFPAIIKFVF